MIPLLNNCLFVNFTINQEYDCPVLLKTLISIDIHYAKSLEEIKKGLLTMQYDFMIIDISNTSSAQMSYLSNLPLNTPIILIGSSGDLAIDAYNYNNVVDFVVKPCTEERIYKSINRVLKFHGNYRKLVTESFSFFKKGTQFIRIDYKDIDYIEGLSNYAKIYTGDTFELVNESISGLTSILPPSIFVRVHKSYIVNIHKIISINADFFYLANTIIPLGRTYRKALGKLTMFD